MNSPTIARIAFVVFFVCAWPPAAQAQVPGGSQSGVNAVILKLLEGIKGFSSKADIRLQEKGVKDPTSMTVDFSMLDGHVRMDLDMRNVKSKELSRDTLAAYSASGMDKVVTILRADRKSALLIYPSVGGYLVLPMSKEEAIAFQRPYKTEKTKLSQETVAGHLCDKTRVIISSGAGDKQEALVWYAPDLNNFPVQIRMEQQRTTLVMQYREVNLADPDARRFQAPGGSTKFTSFEQLTQAASLKAMKGKPQR